MVHENVRFFFAFLFFKVGDDTTTSTISAAKLHPGYIYIYIYTKTMCHLFRELLLIFGCNGDIKIHIQSRC